MKIWHVSDVKLGSNTAQAVCEINKFLAAKQLGREGKLFVPNVSRFSDKVEGIVYLASINTPALRSISFDISFAFYVLISTLRREKPDIIYSRHCMFLVLVLIFAKLFRITYVFEKNGDVVGLARKVRKLPEPVVGLIQLIDFLQCRLSDRVIVLSQCLKTIIQDRYKVDSRKIRVITNGVDPLHFKPMTETETMSIRKVWGIRPGDCVVGSTGQHPSARLDKLIQAALCVVKEIKNVKFLILGKGQSIEQAKKEVQRLGLEKSFVFAGLIEHREVPIYINTCDIVLNFHFQDSYGFSTRIAEFLGCGKPIISVDVEDYKILESSGVAILINPNNETEISEAILHLSANDKLREEMGSKARKLALEKFTWEQVARRILEICSNIKNNIDNNVNC